MIDSHGNTVAGHCECDEECFECGYLPRLSADSVASSACHACQDSTALMPWGQCVPVDQCVFGVTDTGAGLLGVAAASLPQQLGLACNPDDEARRTSTPSPISVACAIDIVFLLHGHATSELNLVLAEDFIRGVVDGLSIRPGNVQVGVLISGDGAIPRIQVPLSSIRLLSSTLELISTISASPTLDGPIATLGSVLNGSTALLEARPRASELLFVIVTEGTDALLGDQHDLNQAQNALVVSTAAAVQCVVLSEHTPLLTDKLRSIGTPSNPLLFPLVANSSEDETVQALQRKVCPEERDLTNDDSQSDADPVSCNDQNYLQYLSSRTKSACDNYAEKLNRLYSLCVAESCSTRTSGSTEEIGCLCGCNDAPLCAAEGSSCSQGNSDDGRVVGFTHSACIGNKLSFAIPVRNGDDITIAADVTCTTENSSGCVFAVYGERENEPGVYLLLNSDVIVQNGGLWHTAILTHTIVGPAITSVVPIFQAATTGSTLLTGSDEIRFDDIHYSVQRRACAPFK